MLDAVFEALLLAVFEALLLAVFEALLLAVFEALLLAVFEALLLAVFEALLLAVFEALLLAVFEALPLTELEVSLLEVGEVESLLPLSRTLPSLASSTFPPAPTRPLPAPNVFEPPLDFTAVASSVVCFESIPTASFGGGGHARVGASSFA